MSYCSFSSHMCSLLSYVMSIQKQPITTAKILHSFETVKLLCSLCTILCWIAYFSKGEVSRQRKAYSFDMVSFGKKKSTRAITGGEWGEICFPCFGTVMFIIFFLTPSVCTMDNSSSTTCLKKHCIHSPWVVWCWQGWYWPNTNIGFFDSTNSYRGGKCS